MSVLLLLLPVPVPVPVLFSGNPRCIIPKPSLPVSPIFRANAQESLVILERVLTENTNPPEGIGSVGDGAPAAPAAGSSNPGTSAAAVAGAAGLLLRPAEAGGFVTGWPFVAGTPGTEVRRSDGTP